MVICKSFSTFPVNGSKYYIIEIELYLIYTPSICCGPIYIWFVSLLAYIQHNHIFFLICEISCSLPTISYCDGYELYVVD